MSNNEKEIRTITTPIKEANWQPMKHTFYTLLCCIVTGLICYNLPQIMNPTAYIQYIDKGTIEIAKDMQAICNERHVCNKDAIIAKMQAVSAEGFVQQAEEGAGLGK